MGVQDFTQDSVEKKVQDPSEVDQTARSKVLEQIVEGRRGDAVQVAMGIGKDVLAEAGGHRTMVANMTVVSTEARGGEEGVQCWTQRSLDLVQTAPGEHVVAHSSQSALVQTPEADG